MIRWLAGEVEKGVAMLSAVKYPYRIVARLG